MAFVSRLHASDIAERPWHAVPADEAVTALATDAENGLDEQEVERRREEFGENSLPESGHRSIPGTFLRQFRDPLIYILLIAGSVSLAIGNFGDAGFIFAVLLFNAVLGSYQEYRAESAAEALQHVMRITVNATRGGRRREIDSRELVPGDRIKVRSGSSVPADIRLLQAQDLRVDESLLTGESTPVSKQADAELDEDTPLGDRATMLYAGSTILSGRGTGTVARTASLTEIGRIAESLTGESQVPPLVLRMRRFTRVIAFAVLAIVVLLGAAQLLRGVELVDIFFLAVALAVSAIPAGLPVAVTVAMAIGSNRMAARNVIVRKLPAVEGLGACTLIGSDKTGTLTENELSARRLRPMSGEDIEVTGTGLELTGEFRAAEGNEVADEDWLRQLATSGALCNEAELTVEGDEVHTSGDTIDIAFLVLARKLDLSRESLLESFEELGNIPFESERRYSATFNRHGDSVVAHVKGAAQTVASMCGNIDDAAVEKREEELAAEGYRVLAVARGEVDESAAAGGDDEALENLEFLGLVGLIDPVRKQVPDAVERCRAAGVDVRMITGDHPSTARAIGRQLGIVGDDEEADDVITGADIGTAEEGDDGEMIRRIRDSSIYARVEPRQKTTIVDTLRKAGHFVTITGDGVNDAPALRAAHIGVAMGQSGTDVARRAADLILTDDNFASIVNGIEEGRIAYDNVRKVIWLLLSTGVAELILFTLSVIFDTPLPLTPVQLLWLNLVTNGIQDVGVAFERGEPGVLDRRPRPPDERILNRLMIEEVIVSGTYMGLVAFAFFHVLTGPWGYETFDARNLLLLLMVLFENVHAFNVRSETRSVFRIPLSANWLLVGAVVVAQLVHIGSMFVPGWRDLLGIEPVAFTTWGILLGMTLTKLMIAEGYKQLRARKLGATRHGEKARSA